MAKKIVIINQLPGYLFGDITNAFVREYDEVVFMAGKVPLMNEALDAKVKLQKIFPYNRNSTYCIKRYLELKCGKPGIRRCYWHPSCCKWGVSFQPK